jgi:hypothetical protein
LFFLSYFSFFLLSIFVSVPKISITTRVFHKGQSLMKDAFSHSKLFYKTLLMTSFKQKKKTSNDLNVRDFASTPPVDKQATILCHIQPTLVVIFKTARDQSCKSSLSKIILFLFFTKFQTMLKVQ